MPAEIGRRLLLLVAVSFAPLFLLFAWSTWRDYRGFQTAQVEKQLEVARGVASAFATFVRELNQHDAGIARQVAGLDAAAAARVLRAEAAQYADLSSLSWTDSEGRVIASSDPALMGRRMRLPPPTAETVIGDLEEGEPMQFSIVTCLYRASRVAGCVVGRMEAEALGRIVFSVPRPVGGAYSIFDAGGALVYRNPPAPLTWESRRTWRERDTRLNGVLSSGQPQAGVETDQPLSGERLVARFPAGDTGWVAGASQPLANTLIPLRRREAETWLLAALVAAAALAAAWRVGLTISGPLGRLEADARAGGSALRSPDAASAPAEVRQLRATLAAMAEGLEQRTAHLRASEERFRRAIEEMPLPVLIFDECGTVLRVSRGWTRCSGYSLADIPTIEEWTRRAYGQRMSDVQSYIMRLVQLQGAVEEGEWTITAAGGEQRVWEFWSAPLGQLEGKRLVISTAFDVTERKRAEERLRLSEEKFATAFAANPAAISLTRLRDGLYVDVNDTWCDLFGFSREEALGHSSTALRIWGSDADREAMVARLREGGALRNWEQTVFRRSGEPIDTLGSAEVVTVAGEPLMLFSVLDITERKRTEAALRASEERFRVAQELSPDGFTILRPLRGAGGEIVDFGILYLNQGIRRILAVGESATGQSIRDALPGTASPFHAIYRKVAENLQPEVMEAGYRNGRGEDFWLRVAVVPLGSDLAALTQDLTQRKRADEERDRLVTELRRSNTELQQFAYISSHDLQEPLRMVASYVQLLERKYRGRLDEQADRYISYAVDGAHRMQKLIDGLLAYSRISTRGAEFRPVNMNQVFDSAVANLALAVRESGAEVTRGELPTVAGDETQLLQLLQNLLANAIKFRRPGETPVVRVSAEQKPDEWQFAVADNGIGIEQEYFERIFQIFQRLHTREEYPGTGIGLALVRRIVERHHGRIWVESTPGHGSTFVFALPERLQ